MSRGNGILAFPSGTLSRYPRFWESVMGLCRAEGDATVFSVGTNVAEGRNRVCRILMERKEFDWILFMDDDHTFARDSLDRLLAWPEPNDIVSACPIQRVPPYGSIAYDFHTIDEEKRKIGLRKLPFSELPMQGLVEVDCVGFGFILVRRRVIAAMDDPWFELGRWLSNQMQEDMHFCYKARKKGFRVFMDCGITAGHIHPMVVGRSPDGRGIQLELGGVPRRVINFYEPSLLEEFQRGREP